ncbi:MAG: DUF1922 domain-containing protein [Candidatus Bathyarchaeia archaeon]|nr:DUF1922 domain-containing protein [Candidatus Bathyarchaeota archaeon]
MTDYIIFACPRCGMVRYAREGQKTARCLKCGYQIQIDAQKIRILARAKNVRDAIDLTKIYKAKKA